MNKTVISFAAITGLLGLAFVTRMDISILLPVGVVLIIISGVLIFISLNAWEKKAEAERKALVERLSPDDMKTTLADALVMISNNLQTLNETMKSHSEYLLEQTNENRQSIVQIYELLNQIPRCLEQNSEQVCKGVAVTADRMHVEFESVSKHLIADIQTYTETFFEKQQDMSVTIISKLVEITSAIVEVLDDTSNSIKESSEALLNRADDSVDSIKSTMKSTNGAIKDLIISLERFGIKNAEIMNKASDGYKKFEIIMNKSLEQMSTISKQDYDLLKELVK